MNTPDLMSPAWVANMLQQAITDYFNDNLITEVLFRIENEPIQHVHICINGKNYVMLSAGNLIEDPTNKLSNLRTGDYKTLELIQTII